MMGQPHVFPYVHLPLIYTEILLLKNVFGLVQTRMVREDLQMQHQELVFLFALLHLDYMEIQQLEDAQALVIQQTLIKIIVPKDVYPYALLILIIMLIFQQARAYVFALQGYMLLIQ
jgi:hypothetical protein